jgi:hypothetical protein
MTTNYKDAYAKLYNNTKKELNHKIKDSEREKKINIRQMMYETEAFNRMKYRIWGVFLTYWVVMILLILYYVKLRKIPPVKEVIIFLLFAAYPFILKYYLVFFVTGGISKVKNSVPRDVYLHF